MFDWTTCTSNLSLKRALRVSLYLLVGNEMAIVSLMHDAGVAALGVIT